MATKYIARTVIEGGRHRISKAERRHSNRVARRRSRRFAQHMRDESWEYEFLTAPRRRPVSKIFHDKLAPAFRWLQSHLGEPWDDVYAEIKRRFDVRTIAGQHIVYDHLLDWVETAECPDRCGHRFHVDKDGLLRRGRMRRTQPRWRNPYVPPKGKRSPSASELAAWTRHRKIARRGRFLFWFQPTFLTREPCTAEWCTKHHVTAVSGSQKPHHIIPGPHYRQATRLTDTEVAYWDSLWLEVQKKLRYRKQVSSEGA